jgi:hypothetical protein
MSVNELSIAASIASIILAILAILLSILFFVLSKKSESATANSLAKIETQADSLQRLTGKWMDRLTRYVTTDKPSPVDESFPQLIAMLAQIPQTITASLTQISVKDNNQQLLNEIYTAYIAIYFYCAQTNYWAQFYLPQAKAFDPNDDFHLLVKRIVDLSNSDFTTMANILAKCDQDKLKNNSLAHLMNETINDWRFQVKSVADVYIAEQKEANQ